MESRYQDLDCYQEAHRRGWVRDGQNMCKDDSLAAAGLTNQKAAFFSDPSELACKTLAVFSAARVTMPLTVERHSTVCRMALRAWRLDLMTLILGSYFLRVFLFLICEFKTMTWYFPQD